MAAVAESLAHERWRLFKDRCFSAVMAIGGVAVLVAIALIFFYLLYVVVPLFRAAAIEPGPGYAGGDLAAAHLVLDEYAEIGFRITAAGDFTFFDARAGTTLSTGDLAHIAAASVSALAAGDPASRSIFAGTEDGRAIVARVEYTVSYPNDRRLITPRITFPLGAEAFVVSKRGESIRLIAGQSSDEETTVAAVTRSGRLLVVNVQKETSFLDDEVTLNFSTREIETGSSDVTHLMMDVDQRELYMVSDDGLISYFDIQNKNEIELIDRTSGVNNGSNVTAVSFLSGGISILVGDDKGRITQWFPSRDAENNQSLKRVRTFEPMTAPVVHIVPEYFRKGFAAADTEGNFNLYYATARRLLSSLPTERKAIASLAFAPRADALIIADDAGGIQTYEIENKHPEVSFQSLWSRVWYESRERPEFIWQSSSASSDFEPKFSLTPLTFGTLKAAFYSMLFAIPLAVLGAIYTAYFMTAPMRAIVKPSIEVMAALPTVILGFLAGLWLAPLLERELLGFALSVVVVPIAILLASFICSRRSTRLRALLPYGWEGIALIPVVCAAIWVSLLIGNVLEIAFFSGSLTHWMTTELGITYDQRNSLVVGVAIGFAVIPTIFSISEDAVFSVPRHLTTGSLALGATPWQTAIKVVLLTASPGIFSAIMIGMGRAVGETMIVLMATGNTPIMDINIFQGFRALSANIAVEMPEAEVDSTHYRILFLAALVLFILTFIVNTAGEVVRQRLRRKYASL